MKIASHFFAMTLLALWISTATAQVQDAGAYLNLIGIEYEKIAQDMMSYTSAAAHGKSARKIDKRRSELLRQLKEAERNVRAMKPFKGDHALRDSIVSYLRICSIVLSEDYAKILNLEDIAEQSYDAMEAYLLTREMANDKADKANAIAFQQYHEFAKTNGIMVIENESKLSKKIEVAGEVIKYHDKVYLLFFKSYKNEAYIFDAMSREDVNALEQTSKALLQSASEDLAKIGAIPPFKGDNILKTACQKVLTFYKEEATNNIPLFVDYYLEKEKFNKIKSAFESKRQQDRKQTDVDMYNNAVSAFNAKLAKINRINEQSNKARSELLDTWNKASDAFMAKHTPRHK